LLAVDASAVLTDQPALLIPECERAEAYDAVAEPTWVRAEVVSWSAAGQVPGKV
jgi:hypothetical protein